MSDIGDRVGDFLNSDRGEKASDGVLNAAAEKADSATGGTHRDQIDRAEQAADDRIGE